MKQWISFLLAVVMLLSCIPTGAMATDDSTGQVISLTLETPPDKTKYLPGEALDLTGLTASAAYSDGSVLPLLAGDLSVESADLSEPGNKTVTLSYMGLTASFEVHVHTVDPDGNICIDPACGDILGGDDIPDTTEPTQDTTEPTQDATEPTQDSSPTLTQPVMTLSNIATGISIKWEGVEGADSYRIYRKVPGGTWLRIRRGLTGQSYTDKNAKYGQVYYYSVRAYRSGLMSDYHESETIVRIEQPTVNLTNTTTGIEASWNQVAAAESYNVYRKVSGGSWKLLSNETGTSYQDETAEDGVTYFYRIRAKNGDTLSSNKQSVQILRLAKPDVTVKNAPTGVRVSWSAVDGAESYRVYRRVPDGSWKALKTGLTGHSYTDTTAQNAAAYEYAVRSYDSTGGSAYATGGQIVHLKQPNASLSNKGTGIRVTWNKVSGVQGYLVFRQESDGSWKLLSTETDTTYDDPAVQSGVTYTYMVQAANADALSSSDRTASILRLDRPTVTAGNGYHGVLVKWNAVEGAQSYNIYRKVPGGSWKTIATGITALKYTDTTAKSGTTYHYTVRSCGDGVLSGYLTASAVEYLSRPSVTAQRASGTAIRLQWNAVGGASEYIVYVKTANTDWTILDTVTTNTYTASGLTLGQTYSFEVRAVSAASRSNRSATVSLKATYPAPDYSVELKSGTGIRISWTAVEGAGSYRVYRRVPGGSWKTLKTTTSTSWVDTTGQRGVTYEYGVRAFELEKAGGVYGIRAVGKKIVYSQIDPKKPMVALTFDDGPSIYTKDILDQLEKYDAHATFFVVGERVSSYASTIRRAHSLGCEIGNHSWSHPNLASISVNSMKSEISRTDAAIKNVIGETPALLRPPYGSVDTDVRRYAGKPLIHWSIDTLDWSTRNSSKTISSVLNNVRDGSIVLMHDIYSATRDAAVSLIPTLISRGYQLVTVSELAAYRGINLSDGTIYYRIP